MVMPLGTMCMSALGLSTIVGVPVAAAPCLSAKTAIGIITWADGIPALNLRKTQTNETIQ
jgi:hypothetical protein